MAIFKAINKSSNKIGGSKGVLEYVGKKATETFGINCSNDYNQAFKQFQETKEFYQKLGGRQYKHFILSLDKDKSDNETLLKIATEASKKLFKNNEVFLAIHNDTDNIHCHIVINSVDIENGKKFQQSSKDLENYEVTYHTPDLHNSPKAVDNIRTEFEDLFICKHNKNINYIEIKKIK